MALTATIQPNIVHFRVFLLNLWSFESIFFINFICCRLDPSYLNGGNSNQPYNQQNNGNQYHGSSYPNQNSNSNFNPNSNHNSNYNPNSNFHSNPNSNFNQNPNQNANVNYHQNSFAPSAPSMQHQQVNQQPDFDPSGIALAPFPDVNSGSNNYDSRKNFNYDNLHHRQPSNQNTQLNSRFSDNSAPYRNYNNDNLFNNNGPIYNPEGAAKVPLAGFGGGIQVPLAPM